jgi:hypothetical protein
MDFLRKGAREAARAAKMGALVLASV